MLSVSVFSLLVFPVRRSNALSVSVRSQWHQRHILRIVQYLVLFTDFENGRGVRVNDALHVRVRVVSILSPSHPNVAGENFLRCAIGQTCEHQLLLPVIGQRPEQQLIAAFVIVGKIGCHKEIAHKNIVRIGDVEVMFSGVDFDELCESALSAVANERLKLRSHIARVVRVVGVCSVWMLLANRFH